MVAIMTCGTAGGTAGQIAEIRVTLTSSDHREACDSSLCATHPIHHHLRVHCLCANTHTTAILIASEINYAESLVHSIQFILQNHLKSIHLSFNNHMHSVLSQQEALCVFSIHSDIG